MRRGIFFVAVLATALTMGLEFSHVLEWPVKAAYPGDLYVRLQESLYVWFGTLGGALYVLAVLAGVVLAVLHRRNRRAFAVTGAAAGAQVASLATFFAVIYPVNLALPIGQGVVPANWEAMRFRWELGHTIGFVLFTTAFVLQVAFLLHTASPGARRTP